MTRPGTFERVYAAIKQQLREGMFRPGERLEPALLSEQLNASVTPVRDALHRLTGERLVEAPRHEGFRIPVLTESTLRHLYAWHRDLVLLAIASRRRGEQSESHRLESNGPDEVHERMNLLFLGLARATGNPEHVLALQSLTERVEPVQRIEILLLDAIEDETENIFAAFRSGEPRALRKALVRYHRRRVRIVPELLERLHRPEVEER